MELVYLWVEDYKNIKKQGFNFSPRFNCNYDEDSNELTIDENDDYIDNFFGDNINITAIVGKNGSGKSSIVTILEDSDLYVGSGFFKKKDFSFIICIEIDSIINIITSLSSVTCSTESIKIQYVKAQNQFDTQESDYLFYDYCSFLTLNSEFPYEIDSRKELFLKNKTISYESGNIANLAIRNSRKNFTFKLTTFMRYPQKIFLYKNTKYANALIDKIQPPIAVYSNNPENGSPFPDCYHEIQELGTENPLEAYMLNKIVNHELCQYLFDSYYVHDIEHSSINNMKALQDFYDSDEYELNEEGYNLYEYEELVNKIIYKIDEIADDTQKLIYKYNKFLIYEDRKSVV